MSLLTATRLCKRQGPREVLTDVSLSLREAESVALVGKSGCGKTTLLQILGLLDQPDSGRLELLGQSVQTLSPAARAHLRLCHLGFVLQQNSLLPHFSLRENIALPAWRLSGSRSLALAQADAWIQRLGLMDVAHQPAGLCSPGEAQRGAVARAVINNPRLVLADEPTGSLDATSASLVLQALYGLCEHGTTLLLVTHDSQVAAQAGRVLRLQKGQLVTQAASPSPSSDTPSEPALVLEKQA